LQKHFEEHVIIEQGIFEDETALMKLISIIPWPDSRTYILKEIQEISNPVEKWKKIASIIKGIMKEKKSVDINPIQDIVFTYTYPRLDVNVSTGLNHLLKSPFCVHPATGAVCVPINPEECDKFSPKNVPHVEQLIQEIDNYVENSIDGKKLKDYKKTSLHEHIKFFKKEFLTPLLQSINQDQLQSRQFDDSAMAF